MSGLAIARRRLHNQRLLGPPLPTPEAVVDWFGAVQAQDYAGATWALAQRTTGATSVAIDRLFDDGAILRTHAMRPTWHFVLPVDLRWLLSLTASRVHAAVRSFYRANELEDALLARSRAVLTHELRDGRYRTRTELGHALAEAGIAAPALRRSFILMHAELEAVVCSGPRRGKQFTYALVDERVPPVPPVSREEALAALTRRYFRSHGPATPHDFAWWSGLTVTEARTGIEAIAGELASEVVEDTTYWFAPSPASPLDRPVVHLLPNYDEHLVAYRDHAPSFDPAVWATLPADDTLSAHIIVLDGLVVGGWRRAIEARQATLTTRALVSLTPDQQDALRRAADAFGRFLGLPVDLA